MPILSSTITRWYRPLIAIGILVFAALAVEGALDSQWEWHWYEIAEGAVTSLLFILLPVMWRMEQHHRKLRAHSEWMAQGMAELHEKVDGRPPSRQHPHFDLQGKL